MREGKTVPKNENQTLYLSPPALPTVPWGLFRPSPLRAVPAAAGAGASARWKGLTVGRDGVEGTSSHTHLKWARVSPRRLTWFDAHCSVTTLLLPWLPPPRGDAPARPALSQQTEARAPASLEGVCGEQDCESQLPPAPATPATPPLSLCKPPWGQNPDETSPAPQRAEPGAGALCWAPSSPGPSPSAGSCLLSGRVHKPFPQITLEQNSFQRLHYLQMRGFRLLSEIQCCFLCKRRGKIVKEEEPTSNANLVRLNCSLNRWRCKAAGFLSLRGRG